MSWVKPKPASAWTMPLRANAVGKILMVDWDTAHSDDIDKLLSKDAEVIHKVHVLSGKSSRLALDGILKPGSNKALRNVFDWMYKCPILTVLKLKSVALSDAGMLGNLAKAIKQCKTLQHLIVEDCQIRDNGCQEICGVLTVCPEVSTLSLEGNLLTPKGVSYISSLLQRQCLSRSLSWWKRSLRGRTIPARSLLGLNRLTLNRNPEIGDEGLILIADALYDDFWMKAVDMKNCGVTEKGAEEVLRLLKVNRELEVFDLRDNEEVPHNWLCAIVQRISKNLGPNASKPIWQEHDNTEKSDTLTISEPSNTSIETLSSKSNLRSVSSLERARIQYNMRRTQSSTQFRNERKNKKNCDDSQQMENPQSQQNAKNKGRHTAQPHLITSNSIKSRTSVFNKKNTQEQ